MKDIMLETVRRAVVDLGTTCSKHNADTEAQRITDMERELVKKDREVEGLEILREDALAAAGYVSETNPALAFIFGQRAVMLLEEANRLRPVALRQKLEQARHQHRQVQLLARLLDDIDLEFLNEK